MIAPYGGGPGMVLKVEPCAAPYARGTALRGSRRVYLGADDGGSSKRWRARRARQRFGLVAGRYEGVEALYRAETDDQCRSATTCSRGRAAGAGVIECDCATDSRYAGQRGSAEQESFSDGLVDWPHYHAARAIDGAGRSRMLMSGDRRIRRWRLQQASAARGSSGRNCSSGAA